MPDSLGDLPLDLSADLAADVADVERALARFDDEAQARHDLEQLARFLLRAEAVASSKIEGLEVNTRRLARHEAKVAAGVPDRDATADAVLGNVVAMNVAVDSVATAPVTTVDHLLEIHAALMERSDRPAIGGQIRSSQNWIGGNDFNPCQASFVPPPPEFVPELLADLCAFVNRDDLPGIVQAGIAHAQFETIHPFADGNGRTGRALIHVVLKRRGLATGFVPPISLILATRADMYVNGLKQFAYDGPPDPPPAKEGVRAWLDFFLAAAQRAATDAAVLGEQLHALEERWRTALTPRRNSAADRLVSQLIAHPVVSADDVIRLTQASRAAAFNAIDQFVAAGVLKQIGGQARYRLFEAPDVFNVPTGYERALATESGDTVPYRRDTRPTS